MYWKGWNPFYSNTLTFRKAFRVNEEQYRSLRGGVWFCDALLTEKTPSSKLCGYRYNVTVLAKARTKRRRKWWLTIKKDKRGLKTASQSEPHHNSSLSVPVVQTLTLHQHALVLFSTSKHHMFSQKKDHWMVRDGMRNKNLINYTKKKDFWCRSYT